MPTSLELFWGCWCTNLLQFDSDTNPICQKAFLWPHTHAINSNIQEDKLFNTLQLDLLWVKTQVSLVDKNINVSCFSSYSFSHYPNDPSLAAIDNGSDLVVHLWFKNFQFTYEEEFIVCDWTCLLGEIGGNLGFFLGGSILAFFDLITDYIFKLITLLFSIHICKSWKNKYSLVNRSVQNPVLAANIAYDKK